MQSMFVVHNGGSVSYLQGQQGTNDRGEYLLVGSTEEQAAAFVEMYPSVHIFAHEEAL